MKKMKLLLNKEEQKVFDEAIDEAFEKGKKFYSSFLSGGVRKTKEEFLLDIRKKYSKNIIPFFRRVLSPLMKKAG